MLRRDRIVAMVTLSLLNIFTITAGTAVVKLTPPGILHPQPPTVAARDIVRAGALRTLSLDPSAPVPGGTLGTRLIGLLGGDQANVNAVVIDAAIRRTLFDHRATVPAVPASTTKLATSVAALAVLGPQHRLTTKVVRSADGGIVLVGGGDPTLSIQQSVPSAREQAAPPTQQQAEPSAQQQAEPSAQQQAEPSVPQAVPSTRQAAPYPAYASLTDLAKHTAVALKAAGVTRVRVDYDASLYQGPTIAAGWKPNYLSDGEIAPVTALMVDEGRVSPAGKSRVADPPGAAARLFAQLLRRYGIVAQPGGPVRAAPTATGLAAVQSPPVSTLVEQTMTLSDNDLAEAMARHVAIKRGRPPTFAGGALAVQEALARLGVGQGIQLADGSGLSTYNRITPMALAHMVALAASGRKPELRPAITGMPVAGFSGTLAHRYAGIGAHGAGVVRAKTGTLTNVSTLAGVAYDADGRLLAFAFMAGNTKTDVTGMLDQLASTAAGCGCG